MHSCSESHAASIQIPTNEQFTLTYENSEIKQQVDNICKKRFKERVANLIDVYQILGIDCTEDFERVQNAFSKKLKDCDPKLHPTDCIKLAAYRELVNAWSKVNNAEKLKYYYRHIKYIQEAAARNNGKVTIFMALDMNDKQENCEPYEVYLSKMTFDKRNNFEATIDPNYYATVIQNLSAEVVNAVGLNYEEVEEIVNQEDPRKFPALIVEISVPLERLAPLESEWGYGMTMISKGNLYFSLRRKTEIKAEHILSLTMMAVYEKTKKLKIQPNTYWPSNFDTWYPPFIDKVKTCFTWESDTKKFLKKTGNLLTYNKEAAASQAKPKEKVPYKMRSRVEPLTLHSIINLYCSYKKIKHDSRTTLNQYLRSKIIGTMKEDTNHFTLKGVLEILYLISQEAIKGYPKYSGTYLGPIDPQDNTVSHEKSISHSVIKGMQGSNTLEEFAEKIFLQMIEQDYAVVFPEMSTIKLNRIIEVFNKNIIHAMSSDVKLRIVVRFAKNFARICPFPDKKADLFIDELLSFLFKKYLHRSCRFLTKPYFIFTSLEETLQVLAISAASQASDAVAMPFETISFLRSKKIQQVKGIYQIADAISYAAPLSNFFTTSQERTCSSTKSDENRNEHRNNLSQIHS